MIGFRDLQRELFEFAKNKNMLEDLRDQHETFTFTIWILDDMWKNSHDNSFEVNQFLSEHETELMDWYLFVRPYKHGNTIAEIYASHKNDQELIEATKKLKSPQYEVVEVADLQGDNKVIGKMFSDGKEVIIRDKNASEILKVGQGFAAILLPYASEYYISGSASIVGADQLTKMTKMSSTLNNLDSEIASFLKHKQAEGLSSKTMSHYKQALEGFRYHMREQPIDDLSKLGLKHIRGYLKSMRRGWLSNYSNYTEQNDITALKQFFKYLYKEGKIRDDKFKYLII